MVGSRLGKAATTTAFVATRKPGAGEPAPAGRAPGGAHAAGWTRGRSRAEDGDRRLFCFAMQRHQDGAPARLGPRGVDGAGGKELAGAVAGMPRSWLQSRSEEGRGAAPSRDGREPCSTEAPSPALVIRALAALRRPA